MESRTGSQIDSIAEFQAESASIKDIILCGGKFLTYSSIDAQITLLMLSRFTALPLSEDTKNKIEYNACIDTKKKIR